MSIPTDRAPTWTIVNLDNPISLPVGGQFDPKIEESRGAALWQIDPGILGSPASLHYIGEDAGFFTFEFMALGTTVIDPYPVAAWRRLNELSKFDDDLGRPPRILFTHGINTIEGFITEIPPAPQEYWGGRDLIRSRIVRQVGPVRIRITKIPKEKAEVSLFTLYIPYTPEVTFETLAKSQYGSADFANSLRDFNQGARIGGQLEVPRLDSKSVEDSSYVSPYFDTTSVFDL